MSGGQEETPGVWRTAKYISCHKHGVFICPSAGLIILGYASANYDDNARKGILFMN
jgi:hypothetical protein